MFLFRFKGQPITTIKAVDADSPGKQSEIRYRILDEVDQLATHYFRIDELTGGIFPLERLDHEEKDTFIFDVEASDSMPSSLPYTKGFNKGIFIR